MTCGGQPRPPGTAPIKLSIAETTRLAGLARQHTAGLISPAVCCLAAAATAAPGHRPLASLQRPATSRDGATSANRKEVTECNTLGHPRHLFFLMIRRPPRNRNCNTYAQSR